MPRLTPHFPVSGDLVGPWDEVQAALRELGAEDATVGSIGAKALTAKQQAINLNNMLTDVQRMLAEIIAGTATLEGVVTSIGKAGSPLTGDVVIASGSGVVITQVGQVITISAAGGGSTPGTATDSTTYALEIVGPDISISGTSFLPITKPTSVAQHTSSKLLAFWWEAGNAGVNAQWRLRNQQTGVILMSGAQAAPFSRTMVTSLLPATVMPSAGQEVALEVCFSAAGTGGEIELSGQVTWEVL